MPITNPQAIAFSNNFARKAADKLAQAYFFAKIAVAEWNQVSALFPNDTNVLRDSASPTDDLGTGGDGRMIVTGAEMNLLITRLQEKISDYEATSSAKLNTILAVAVNPTNG
jgi:hypothetical protein